MTLRKVAACRRSQLACFQQFTCSKRIIPVCGCPAGWAHCNAEVDSSLGFFWLCEVKEAGKPLDSCH